MNKLNFIRTTLSALDKDIKALVEKFGTNPNGNAVNALVKKYEALAYETGFWWNGEYSTHTKDKSGNWLKIQENRINFRDIINRRVKAA